MKSLFAVALVAALTVCTSINARSEQDARKLLFENDQLRVVEYMMQVDGKLALQSHAPCLFFAVTPLAAALTFNDGQRVTEGFKLDDPRWYENPIVAVANTGKSEAKFLIIEIKKPAPTRHGDVPADDGTKVASDVYKLLFENDRVRVIRVGYKPGQKTPMHSHPGTALRYPMANTKVRFTTPEGTMTEVENKEGVARWSESPARHVIENIGVTEGHTLLVEMK